MPNKKQEEDFGFTPHSTEDDLGFTPTGQASLSKPTETQQPDFLQRSYDAAKSALTTPLPASVPLVGGQSVSQVLTMPQRGMRGLGVGAEKLLQNVSLNPLMAGMPLSPGDFTTMANNAPNALQRAAEAIKPGFKPEDGEKIGSFVGETVGSLPLAAALTGGGAAAPAALGRDVIFSALKGAGGGASLSAIQQASERGDIDLHDVAYVAATGALIPIIVPTGKMLMNVVKTQTRHLPSIGTTLSKEAAGELMDDPKLVEKYAGTATSIKNRVTALQQGLVSHLEKISNKLAEARAAFNITEPIQDSVERVAKEGFTPKPAQEVMSDFLDLQRGYQFVPSDTTGVNLLGTAANKIIKKDISPTDQIRGLYLLRQDLGDLINYPKVRPDLPAVSSKNQAMVSDLYSQVNNKIDSMIKSGEAPKGAEMLRLTDKAYSQSRSIYDELQKKLSTNGQAEQVLMRIAKGENPDEILGVSGDVVETIRRLEKKTGVKYLDDLRKDIHVKNIKNIKATSAAGGFTENTRPENLGLAFDTVKGATSVLKNIIEAAGKSGAIPSVASRYQQ